MLEHAGFTGPPKPRVTIVCRSFPPAYLRGGPARSLGALVEALGEEFRFSVITSAYDESSVGTMPGIQSDQWSRRGSVAVWYSSKKRPAPWGIARLIRALSPDVLYLNSQFDVWFAVLPLLACRLTSRTFAVLLAPRGELSLGALSLKRRKKRLFLSVYRLLRLDRFADWHASTEIERSDIERVYGTGPRIHVASDLRLDLPAIQQVQGETNSIDARRLKHGETTIVYLSRIVPKKNLATLLNALPLLEHSVHLSIAGPIEDKRYWRKCERLIRALPKSQTAAYVGTILPHDVVAFLERFDLFVLPTLGENFGHVVLESLAAATPVIVGNDTPWQRVQEVGAGMLCDPSSPPALARQIDQFVQMSGDEQRRMRLAARRFARELITDPSGVDANRAMFRSLASRHRQASR
jgi:glycosyltransferase involved in cell wall biosynthesis